MYERYYPLISFYHVSGRMFTIKSFFLEDIYLYLNKKIKKEETMRITCNSCKMEFTNNKEFGFHSSICYGYNQLLPSPYKYNHVEYKSIS